MTDVSEPSAAGMVERVARALCRRDSLIDPGARWIDEHWPKYAADARAAIAAMREPTEGMTQCGAMTPEGFAAYPNTCEVVWKGMIDSALAEDTA